MVEVVNIDSDEEEDNLAHYTSLLDFVRQLSPSEDIFLPLVSNLNEVRRRCPDTYLSSPKFRQHVEACREGLNYTNVVKKLHVFAQNMASNYVETQSLNALSVGTRDALFPGHQYEPSQKRRRLDPPRLHIVEDLQTKSIPTVVSLPLGSDSSSASRTNVSSSHVPTGCKKIPVQTIRKLQSVLSTSSLPASTIPTENASQFNNIVDNLKKIQTSYSDESDVTEVMRIFIDHIISLNLDKKNMSVTSIETYCAMLLKVRSPLSLLYHLRRLLMMKYFMEIKPVEIKPSEWFSAHYQIVSYHLSEYVTFAIFKRLLAKVLPPTKAKMVELFQQKFRRLETEQVPIVMP